MSTSSSLSTQSSSSKWTWRDSEPDGDEDLPERELDLRERELDLLARELDLLERELDALLELADSRERPRDLTGPGVAAQAQMQQQRNVGTFQGVGAM